MASEADTLEYEFWKDIPGWEGLYQASSLGRIRSVPRTKRHKAKSGKWYDMPLKGRVLSLGRRPNGYLIVALSDLRTGRKPKTFRVNRLVCETFHGPPKCDRIEAAHNDGIRDNNRADNLRWATRAENLADIPRHRRLARGRRQPTGVR